MSDMVISIKNEYSDCPAGRTGRDGPYNGERFLKEILLPRLKEASAVGCKVIVDFNDLFTCTSSFLEEAFGGLIRLEKQEGIEYHKNLEFKAEDIAYKVFKTDAEQYINEELRRK